MLLSNNKLDVYMTVINMDIKHQRCHNTAEQRMQKAFLSVAYLETVNVNRFYQKEAAAKAKCSSGGSDPHPGVTALTTEAPLQLCRLHFTSTLISSFGLNPRWMICVSDIFTLFITLGSVWRCTLLCINPEMRWTLKWADALLAEPGNLQVACGVSGPHLLTYLWRTHIQYQNHAWD